MDQRKKNWYDVRAAEIAAGDHQSRITRTLGTLEGILDCTELSPEEIVERCRYFLAQLDKAVKEAKR